MIHLFKLSCLPSLLFISCACPAQAADLHASPAVSTLSSRFPPPAGFERTTASPGSFTAFLRQLPLKPEGSKVRYWDGKVKENRSIYAAVIDLPISARNLHQCADAVMRLRAEWLFAEKRFSEIRFHFLRDGKPRFYEDFVKGDHSRARFLQYMDFIFESANTASLFDELIPVRNITDMQPGDVLIQKGRPYGHAVMVADISVCPETGEKLFLIVQSYMPAQEIQVLQNPGEREISPWYRLRKGRIVTPEWTFEERDLRRF